MAEKKEVFGGRFAVVMALAGSAIGLGNIWRFPYMVGEHGGAAFILVYVLCAAFIALPIFIAESIIGRHSGCATNESFKKLAPGSKWGCFGFITVFTAFVISSFYSVVGGWSVDYLIKGLAGKLVLDTPVKATEDFTSFSSSVWEPISAHLVFLGASTLIVWGGVRKGIEKFSKITMPVLLVLMLVIMFYSISLPGAEKGIRYLLRPDFSRMDISAVAYALGQSFFSLSLGVGCVLTYSSYTKKSENLFASAGLTTVFDLTFALIAGMAVMPAVFSAGIEPGAGPSLVFETLPYIFSTMGLQTPVLSRIVTVLFFLSIVMAALSSEVSMCEVCTAHLIEKWKMSRGWASFLIFACAGLTGILCSLSFGPLSGFKLFGQTVFGFCDVLSSNYLMTLGSLAFALFVGWKMGKPAVRDEFTNNGSLKFNNLIFNALYLNVKFVAPVMIVVIFISNLFL